MNKTERRRWGTEEVLYLQKQNFAYIFYRKDVSVMDLVYREEQMVPVRQWNGRILSNNLISVLAVIEFVLYFALLMSVLLKNRF